MCLFNFANAKTIVWVSDAQDSDLDGVPSDQGWIDFLEASGYEVNYEYGYEMTAGNGYWVDMDGGKLDELEAADLIIIGRATNSGDYATDFNEILDWNLISTPIIMQTAYICRNSRWQWLNTGATLDVTDTLEVIEPDHPIFKDVPMIDDNKIAVIDSGLATSNISFPVISDPGNGTLLAARADTGGVWIVEWEANLEFYDYTDQYPAGKRMYFSLGESGGSNTESIGFKNTTEAGDALFLNAVKYMIGDTLSDNVNSRLHNTPTGFELSQNYPNPFNPTTSITFNINKSDIIRLDVFNINGRRVAEVINEFKAPGLYHVEFDATNLNSGLYFYKLSTSTESLCRKMTVMK
jgi:hypothetical protein